MKAIFLLRLFSNDLMMMKNSAITFECDWNCPVETPKSVELIVAVVNNYRARRARAVTSRRRKEEKGFPAFRRKPRRRKAETDK